MSKPQVVITRKDKRLHKGWHALAFMLTGGASAPITAAKAGTNAAYNARTRKLAESETPGRPDMRAIPAISARTRGGQNAYWAARRQGMSRREAVKARRAAVRQFDQGTGTNEHSAER